MFRAFLQLDFHIWRRYKFQVITELFHGLVMLSLFYYLSKSWGPSAVFHGEYFPFFVVGIAFAKLYQGLCSGATGTLKDWQQQGVLESIFASPIARWKILLLAGLSTSVVDVGKSMLLLILAILFFGVRFEEIHWVRIVWVSSLTLWACLTLSLISAASILLWKRVSLVSIFSSLVTMLLAGVYFPVNILPEFLQKISFLIPFTHAMNLLRWGFLNQTFDFNVHQSVLVLCSWCVGLTIFVVPFFRFVEKKLMLNGRLSTF